MALQRGVRVFPIGYFHGAASGKSDAFGPGSGSNRAGRSPLRNVVSVPMLSAMSNEPIAFSRAARPAARQGQSGHAKTIGWSAGKVRFDRSELNRILNLYGRMVVAGEWRDYAIDFLEDAAVFSVYRRTSEMPLYRIERRPKLRDRQGQYAVVAAGGQILKRGHDLATVLRVLERRLVKAVQAAE